ncbi:MAG: class I SAM-dependent methyltransferase [Gammaproteobacteria bacterium]
MMARALVRRYFNRLYERTMREAYACAFRAAAGSLQAGGQCLDCGANEGQHFARLNAMAGLTSEAYFGVEWHAASVAIAQGKGLQVIQGDLNTPLPFESNRFQCVMGLSVLEHLLSGCRWMRECQRVLVPGGRLVMLTPNISTWFTIALLAVGRMPSSGPHPDSGLLLKRETLLQVSQIDDPDVESDTPVHRHLVVFSYRTLRRYLRLIGLRDVQGRAFGVYPFPNTVQPWLEKVDPYHAHQMVFVATKS